MKNKLFKIAIAIITALGLNAQAADNSIYIDQAGDNATVSVTQDGAGNSVRGLAGVGTNSQTPAKIYGDGNQVSVSQIGSGNTLRLGINTTTATGASTVNYSVSNSMNSQADIKVGTTGTTSTANTVNVTQSGNSSVAAVTSLGASKCHHS